MSSETCPKCQFPKQSATALECPRCGIVFARYRDPVADHRAAPSPRQMSQVQLSHEQESPFEWVEGVPMAELEALPRDPREAPPQPSIHHEPEPLTAQAHRYDFAHMLGSEAGSKRALGLGSPQASTKRQKWGWMALGFCMALVLSFSVFPRWIFGILSVLIHEMGHAAFAWLFGRPAIPSLDLINGGGITPTFSQSPLLVGLIALSIYLPFAKQRHEPGVNLRAGLCIGLYLVMAFTSLSQVLLIAGGHLTVLISIVYCLHQVMRGTNFKTPLDPPLYAIIGFFNEFHLLNEFWKLTFDPDFRVEYEQAKGGLPSDFASLGEILGVGVAPLAGLALMATLAMPVLVYQLDRRGDIWQAWLRHQFAKLTGRA